MSGVCVTELWEGFEVALGGWGKFLSSVLCGGGLGSRGLLGGCIVCKGANQWKQSKCLGWHEGMFLGGAALSVF